MNYDKIKELAEQAGIQEDLVDHLKDEVEVLTYIARPQDIQKFAELIVRECISELEISKEGDRYTGELFVSEKNTILSEQIEWLKEHFGVKE